MNIKNYFLSILLIFPFILSAQKSKSSTIIPVAYVEQSKLLKTLSGFEQNTKELDSIKQVYTNEIKENLQQLDGKIKELLKPYQFNENETLESIKSKLKENDLAKLDLYIQESELIDKSSKNYDLMIKTLYNQKVQPLLDKLNAAIEEYAKTNNIQMVYILENISPALAYVNKGINITENVKILILKL